MAKREKLKPEQVVAALKETGGLVYLAAERLDCVAQTVYNYANRYPAVKEAMKHQKGRRLDTAEASLWKAILAGEAWAVCFYLKTQGKERGYVERTELVGGGGDTAPIRIEQRLAIFRERYAADAPADAGADAGAEPVHPAPADDPAG
jgi:hypothetical protein